ncbi:hypothetical protein ABPG74_020702 [Tetrahymena malaccensis]
MIENLKCYQQVRQDKIKISFNMILNNEQKDYLLSQIKVFLPGDIEFIKYDVFLEKQAQQQQYLSVKYKQKKNAFYLELEGQKQTQQFPPSQQLQFDIQNEFDILTTQKVETAILSNNQPTQSKNEYQNGIQYQPTQSKNEYQNGIQYQPTQSKNEYQNGIQSFEIQFFPVD